MRLFTCSTALALSILAAASASAQTFAQPVNNDEKQEFALTVGELSGSSPNEAGISTTLGSGVGIGANYARRFHDYKYGSLYWEVDVLGGPLRYLSVSPNSHAVRSVFAEPGLKFQFTPDSQWSPWVALGGGYAFYDANATVASGATVTSTELKTSTYAADFGAGVDWVVRPHLVIRGEARGIYTGGPNLGLGNTSGLMNFTIGGGLVWRMK